MSRSGYYEDDCYDQWAHIMYRGAVASAMRGKKGKAFLTECLAALEAMPVKRLAAHTYEAEGEYCTLGVVGKQRGMDLSQFDVDYGKEEYAQDFGVNEKVLREIIWENDEFLGGYDEKGNFLGKSIRREKFGPPRYQFWSHRNWTKSGGDWDTEVLQGYAPNENMYYYEEREELPYERWEYMVKWLKEKINENINA